MFSGFLEQTDSEIGRFEKALEDIGEMDNTLFIYIAGDNGTSAEGGFVGMYNEMTYFNGVTEKVEDLIPLIDKWGGPETFPHMAAGWAVAFDTPFSWTKQVASDFGGTRNGMVIHWPQGIKDKGGLRSQFSHVIDIAPTILEAAGLPEPKSRQRHAADARSRARAWSTPSTMRRRRSGTRRSTSRCSAIARSTAMAGWPAPSTARHGRRAACSR